MICGFEIVPVLRKRLFFKNVCIQWRYFEDVKKLLCTTEYSVRLLAHFDFKNSLVHKSFLAWPKDDSCDSHDACDSCEH